VTNESVQQPVRASDFYTESVLPVLAERLDRAFPEFGWRRDANGWVATNEQHTHARLGVRAERVVAHGPAPRGFLIHGGEATLWTAYVSGGAVPRGADFIRAVRDLAERAGVDPSPLDRPQSHDRRLELLRDFFDLCRREFLSERGDAARAYLERRGLPREAIADSGLGVVPPSGEASRQLERAGYRPSEVASAGVLADSRWPGRLCGAWRDGYGRIGTFWARALDDQEATDTRYLYLRGASRTNLPPYGLSDLLGRPSPERREVVLVEGFLDVHQLRARGIENVAALGGTSIRAQTFERLNRLGIEAVTLCLDNDRPGRAATARAVENATRARRGPELYVVDSERLAPAKDPDELVRQRGIAAWRGLLEARTCGIAWRAHELAAVTPESPLSKRRAALARAGRWLGTLPPRLALEQEDAVREVAEKCGYSSEAVARFFRARFWGAPQHERPPARSRSDARVLGFDR
jgi:DNA primase